MISIFKTGKAPSFLFDKTHKISLQNKGSKNFSLDKIKAVACAACAWVATAAGVAHAEAYTVFNGATFYDGYKTDAVVDADKNDGILRLTNYLYAAPLDVDALDAANPSGVLAVTVKARCDNYDRMGRVSLVFVPKGTDYRSGMEKRIEIARFITPFMNKNKRPNEVPYIYEIGDVMQILNDGILRNVYNFWLETELFGIPYDAQAKIMGCATRNDVFSVTVSFPGREATPKLQEPEAVFPTGEIPVPEQAEMCNIVLPINHSICEIAGDVNFNNHNSCATDTLGTTTRTFRYHVPQDLDDAQLVLINSNHGANEDGEEYVRRKHLIYIDGELTMAYTPGGTSCEPYRQYNTQGNMIYSTERSEEFWQETSNWCPGEAIPTRRIHLGPLAEGAHEVMLRVPDAEFADGKGDFRPSLYLHGTIGGKVAQPSGVENINADAMQLAFSHNAIVIPELTTPGELCIYTISGETVYGSYVPAHKSSCTVNLDFLTPGVYAAVLYTASGNNPILKFAIK